MEDGTRAADVDGSSRSAERIVVLGGGYVATTLVRQLRRAMRTGRAQVTVVTRDNFHSFHGFVPEMVVGRISPANILSPARRAFPPAKVHVAEIESIDLAARNITTSRDLDGARFELGFDHLVLGLGSAENSDAYPGLAEHAFKLKTYDDCFRLRNHIVQMFELADIETDPEERRRLLTFFVAGGGFSGTELAAELADLVRLLTKREYPGIEREECRVVLVHPGETILPELYGGRSLESKGGFPHLVEYATDHIRRLGVELMTETRVVGTTPIAVHLSNGVHVPTRTVISAVGTRASPLLDQLDVPRDDRGRVKVDEFLRVDDVERLWAGGDCAAVPHPRGGTCPPVGLYAIQHGRQIGRNLARELEGRPLRPFRFAGLGQGVSIGRRRAVGEVKGIALKGTFTWLIWRLARLRYVPSRDRQVHILADWLLSGVVGRDIVQLLRHHAGDFDVRQNVFQPGETIAERRRPVRLVHIVIEGEVELLHSRDGEAAVFETIGPGDHFGRKSLEYKDAESARAKTAVRTLALREDQANELQDALLSTGRITARTGVFDAAALRRGSAD